MCGVCDVKANSDSPMGPTPTDVPALVKVFAKEQNVALDALSRDELVQFAIHSLFKEGYISIVKGWVPDGNSEYMSKYDSANILGGIDDVEIHIGAIDVEKFHQLSAESEEAGAKYLIDILGLDGKVDAKLIMEQMKSGIPFFSPEPNPPARKQRNSKN